MSKAVILSLSLLLSANAFAKSVSSESLQIAPSSIDQVVRLVDKKDPGSSAKKVSIVVEDHGLSTDVSPRYTVYLGYASLAEMGNISADFKIDDQVFEFKSATRKAAGIYEIKVVGFTADGALTDITHTVDTNQMFIDERKARTACGGDFCDQTLKTSVEVKSSAK
ncbi:hypothetical protein [Bdellovibrio sp.]|uniref:hypothetical protein n=1 Tax=Bdellovibrio TaxID=958 RepID=UPI003221E60C